MIKVYVINLARSADRRAWMKAELARVGVEGVFVAAVDGRRGRFRRHGGCGRLSSAETALTLSHRKVWRRFAASGDAHAVVLEDDVHLGRDFAAMLARDWRSPRFDVVKLETLFDRVWLARRGEPVGARALHRLGAEHLGSAAYIVSREGARKLLARTRTLEEPIDHSLFGRRPITDGEIVAWQLAPAIVVQDNLQPNVTARRELASTLHESDRKRLADEAKRAKPRGAARLRREAARLVAQARRWIRLAPTMRRQTIPWE
jgi:glycosyl transferase family 25